LLIYIQPLFISYCVYDYFSTKQPSIGFYPAAVESIIMIIAIIYFYFELMQEIVLLPVYTVMEFWIATALIIYFSGNFFLFVYSKTMIGEESFQVTYKFIYSSTIILKNTIISISIKFLQSNLQVIKNKNTFEESSPFYPEL